MVGPDGLEDVTITETCSCIRGISLSSANQRYVNIGNVYQGTSQSFAGHTYAGYRINGGGLKTTSMNVTPLAIGLPTFTASVHTQVEFVYTHNSHTITTEYVDGAGKSLRANTTTSVAYDDPFSTTAQSIAGYTYSGWRLNGGSLQSGNPSIAKVDANATISLVYAVNAAPTPTPNPNPIPTPTGPDYNSYEFVKKPNVANVSAGQTVNYTFAGFGNAWAFEIERYTIADKPDKGLDFVSASLPAFTNGAGVTYDVVYYTSSGAEVVMHSGVSAASPFSFSAPSLASGEYITSISLEFGTVPAGFAVGDTFEMTFKVWDNPPAQTLNNVGLLYYKVGDEYYEFTTGESGTVTLGGWFSGLAKMGDETLNLMAFLIVLIGVAGFASYLARRRRKADSRVLTQ